MSLCDFGATALTIPCADIANYLLSFFRLYLAEYACTGLVTTACMRASWSQRASSQFFAPTSSTLYADKTYNFTVRTYFCVCKYSFSLYSLLYVRTRITKPRCSFPINRCERTSHSAVHHSCTVMPSRVRHNHNLIQYELQYDSDCTCTPCAVQIGEIHLFSNSDSSHKNCNNDLHYR